MRFAPPKRLRIADRERGLNQISVRSYNERLVLSLLLQNQGISRLDIGQSSGLSAQTVSVIVRSLEQEGLVVQGKAQRGRVGPPTIPISLNPEGAYSMGVSIGLRETEVVLIDFVGAVLYHSSSPNLSLEKADIYTSLVEGIPKAIAKLPTKLQNRVAGIGLALPSDIETLNLLVDSSGQSLTDIQMELEDLIGMPIFVQNDITAAASGESMFGVAKEMTDYLFFFLGERLHSRLILNHQIFNGNYSIAPVSLDMGILKFEKELVKRQMSTEALWDSSDTWPEYGDLLETWRRECCTVMGDSVKSLAQFVNIDTIVLSSIAPCNICQEICLELEKQFAGMKAVIADITTAPIAVGAASLPFSSRFMIQETLQSTPPV
jgi:predicted NBD/HSP70 family sugar kinase/biotin operon repressor